MKTLILTCNTGEGHNSASAALIEEYEKRGDTCEIADTLSFLSRLASRAICRWHTQIYRYMPAAFDVGYRTAEKHPDALHANSGVYKILTLGTEKLYKFMKKGNYDAVICPHVFSAVLVTSLRKRHPDLHFIACFIATDYTCSPMVAECDMDAFVIPDESLREDFVSKGVAPDRIVSAGIPVRQSFMASVDRASALAACGLPENVKHIMMMCGSMGCGPMEELAKELIARLPDDAVLTVLCGTNGRLRRRLSGQFSGLANIRILGFVRNVSEMMDCTDLYLTKPGGLSVTEAANKRVPMVFVDAVAGCEEYNLRFFAERGMAVNPESKEPTEVAKICAQILSDGERLDKMRARMGEIFARNASGEICDFLTAAVQKVRMTEEKDDKCNEQ